jgi:hypothetical protein
MYRPKLQKDFTVEREGEPPNAGYIITFDQQVSKVYCIKLEWSTRKDLETTGSAP